MRERLKDAFYNVMYKYELPFSENGVLANIDQWMREKASLLELLRKHPAWREEELAIVFSVSEQRGISGEAVDQSKYEMMALARCVPLTHEQMMDFRVALDAATQDYARVPDESRLSVIQERGHIRCAPGQKSSRIINKLCQQFHLDQYEEEKVIAGEKRMVRPYNAIFARLADALNPVEIQKTAVLSIHPCDFLEMSNKDNTWESCHRLNGGGYRGGCQSYMGDSVSMIFFTVDEKYTHDFYRVPRISREIFCYNGGVLLQSRLYPTDDGTVRDLYRSRVQGAIAECLGVPNLWTTKREKKEIEGFWDTEEDSNHYEDYNCGYAVLSLLKGMEKEDYGRLYIGSIARCTCCGGEQKDHAQLKCSHCTPVVVCRECGATVPKVRSRYQEGVFFCNDCLHECAVCGTYFHGTVYPAYNKQGKLMEVCAGCYQEAVSVCENCRVHQVCRLLNGMSCCPEARYTAA